MAISPAEAFQRLRDTFADAASRRRERQDFDELTGELGWVLYERERMTAEVNAIRAENGLPPVDGDLVRNAETTSCGHIDYAQKYALGCAELTRA